MKIDEVKSAIRGREREVLVRVAGLPGDILDGKNHPCPKCGGDDRFALVNEERGAVHCRGCLTEKNGDAIAAVKWSLGLATMGEAANEVARHFGLNGYAVQLPPSRKFSTATPAIAAEPASFSEPVSSSSAASPDELDRAYRALQQSLTLTTAHRQALRGRGLTDTQIDANGYRTHRGKMLATAATLLAELGADLFSRVPGFYLKDELPHIAGGVGLLIFVRDAMGRFVGVQVRPDKPSKDGPKYYWLSSKKHGGPSVAPPPIHFPLGTRAPAPVAIVTESPFKADIISAITGTPTIGLPGAGNSQQVVEALQQLQVAEPCLALDADAATEESVAKALVRLTKRLQEAGYNPSLIRWPAEIGKGYDDALTSGRADEITTLQAGEAITAIREIVASAGIDFDKVSTKAAAKRERGEFPGDDIPDLVDPEGRTELANAKRFRQAHGSTSRWVEPWNKWMVFDGKRWDFDTHRLVDARAKDIPAWIWAQAEQMRADQAAMAKTAETEEEKAEAEGFKKVVADVVGYARSSSSAYAMRNFIALARSETGIPVLPEVFDADPYLFNVANGIIDLRTGELLPHTPDRYLTKLSPVEYIADAQAPTWLNFLRDVFAGDEELITFIKRSAGYSLTAKTNERCLFFLYGRGRNGKTTLVSTLQKVFGDYATQVSTELLMAAKGERHPTEICDLAGRRMAIASETESGRHFAESFIKSTTGGEDVLKGRRMREDHWEFRATHKLWISGNHKPRIKGTDDGIWDRLRLIPFNVRFEKPDRSLPDKLQAELPGILAWMVAGCREWQVDGLREPEVVRKATAEYRKDSNVVGRFIDECCSEREMYCTTSEALYKAFAEWNGGRPSLSRIDFGVALAERGLQDARMTCGPDKGKKCWQGIGLFAKGSQDEEDQTSEAVKQGEVAETEK